MCVANNGQHIEIVSPLKIWYRIHTEKKLWNATWFPFGRSIGSWYSSNFKIRKNRVSRIRWSIPTLSIDVKYCNFECVSITNQNLVLEMHVTFDSVGGREGRFWAAPFNNTIYIRVHRMCDISKLCEIYTFWINHYWLCSNCVYAVTRKTTKHSTSLHFY